MTDTQKMQADGGGKQPGKGRDTEGEMQSGGQSAGDDYPNDAPSAEEGGFLGHGGQSENAYHGGDQLGEQTVEEARHTQDRAR